MRIYFKLGIAVLLATGWLLVAFVLLGDRVAISRAKPLAAGTLVSANISSNETWDLAGSPYTLTTDIIVNAGVTLTIEPGVVVKGADNAGLRIDGHLEAVGTASQPITFTSTANSGGAEWAGLIFYGTVSNQGTGNLDYVTVRYWGDANIVASAGLGIKDSGGQVVINHSQIISGSRLGSDYGLYIYNSQAVLSDTVIAYNGDTTADYGLYAIGSSSVVTATNLTVQGNMGTGVVARSSSRVTVSNSTVSNNGSVGVDADSTSDIRLSNTTVSNNGGLAVRLPGRSVAQALNGSNSFSGNAINRLVIPGGTIDGDATWGAATGLTGFELEQDTIVGASATLTIAPGVTVYGQDNAGLRIDGHLEAVGTASQPITFTSTANSGGAEWAGLIFYGSISNQSTGNLDYVTVRYWGDANIVASAGLGIKDSGGQVVINHSQIISGSRLGSDYGLYIYNSQAVLSDTVIAYNGDTTADYGLYAIGSSSVVTATNLTVQGNMGTGVVARSSSRVTVSNSTVSNNGSVGVDADSTSDIRLSNTTVSNNGGLAVRLPGRSVAQALNGSNSFSGNAINRLVIPGGTIDGDATWGAATGLTGFELEQDTIVGASATLTIAPGVTVYGQDNAGLRIDGHLEAVGTASQPITFTSTANSGGAEWAGLIFYGSISNQSTGNLDYVTVRYWGDANIVASAGLGIKDSGGQVVINHSQIISGSRLGSDYGLYIYNSQAVLSDTVIAYNGDTTADYGLYAIGSSSVVTISDSCLINNSGTGIYLASSASNFSMIGSHLSGNGAGAFTNTTGITVPATFSWWGHPSGPTHAGNVLGSGDAVSDFVNYSDFLDEPTCNSFLRIAKQAPDTAIAGQPITYTLTVFNRSAVTATNVVITDAIPAGASVSSVLDGGSILSGGQVIKWLVDDVPGQISRTVRFIVTADEPLLNNDYRVTASDGTSSKGIIPIETTVVRGGSGEFIDSGQALGSGNSQAVSLVDLDGDGDLDAVVGNGSPNEVWLNEGNGTFTQSQASGNETSQSVALADLNGDDLPDLVAANSDTTNGVWLNNGNGTFGTTSGNDALADNTFGSSNNQAVALGDLNGDGTVDAFVANSGGNQLWLNDGSGSFTTDPSQSLGSGSNQAVALGDFDGDGDLDAVVGSDSGSNSQVWLNNGSGVFTTSTTLGSAGGQAVTLGDVNRDGHTDILLAGGGTQANQVWLGTGSGTFNINSNFLVTNTQAIDLGDVDGDGDLDAVIAVGNNQPSRVWLNNGSGQFFDSGQSLGAGDSTGVGIGDLDGDGDLDTFIANAGNGTGEANQVYFNRNQLRKIIGAGGDTLVDVTDGLTTTINIPPLALSEQTSFTFTIISQPSPPVSATLRFARRAFTLIASQNGLPVSDPFSGSFTITVEYDPTGLTNENGLTLRYRDEGVTPPVWRDVAETCPADYVRTPGRLDIAVCHLTEFALFEPNTAPVFTVTGSPLLTPTLGVIVTQVRPVFDWEDAADDFGSISYTLTITGSGIFTGVGGQATTDVVTVTESTFTPAISLPVAAYTWTVRAWDEAGLPSGVITPATFQIAAEDSGSHVFLPVILKNE